MKKDEKTGRFVKEYSIEPPNPSGLCLCGCGQKTPAAKITNPARGTVKGHPVRFIRGHFSRTEDAKQGYKERSIKMTPPNPSGLCMCGCGNKTLLAIQTSTTRQMLKGYPLRYLQNHGPKLAGAESHKWKGGRFTHKSGYVYVYAPDHPNSNAAGYVFEHRLVVERRLGRLLLPDEQVHHANRIKDDNRDKNLVLLSFEEHKRLHREDRKKAMSRPEVRAKLRESGKKGAISRWGK